MIQLDPSKIPVSCYENYLTKPYDISICLVSWNTRELLRQCIGSILDTKNELRVEIFVIDNASSDGSADMVETYFPQVKLIRNTENVGFAQANNQGIKQSKGRYVFLLNPDTIVLEGTLKHLSAFLDHQPDAGAVAAKLLNADWTLQYSIRKFPDYLTPFTENPDLYNVPFMRKHAYLSRMRNWDHNDLREVEQPAGAAFMVKRSVIETIGTLNNRYHMFFEDVDLCLRIRKSGWRIYYFPEARIIHFGGQSVKQRHNIGSEFYKSMLLFFYLHHGRWGLQFARVYMVLISIFYLFYAPLRVFNSPGPTFSMTKAALSVARSGMKKPIITTIDNKE